MSAAPESRPLIGRDDEAAELARLVGLDGPPAAGRVLLGGDAGVGKTRLLDDLRTRAGRVGWRCVVGHCLDFGDAALPYLPFREIIGSLERREQGAAGILLGRRQWRSSSDAPVPERTERTERADLVDAVHRTLEAMAAEQPLLVVVEDLHWADRSTRDLLTLLFTRGFEAPVTLVASYRSDDLHRRHPLRENLAHWTRLPGLHRLALGPLPDAEVRRLVDRLDEGLDHHAVQAIVTRAEGNPFFVEELVGAAGQTPDGAAGRDLPADLAAVLLVRLDRLEDDARLVARAAACAGRQVSHRTLAAVAGLGSRALEAALRAAVERNVLVPDGEAYAFRHALLAEAVYDDLLPGERIRLHATYAAALAEGRIDGSQAELARHARLAHDLPTALAAGIRAGDEAMALGGPDEAARHYALALGLVDGPVPDAEIDRVTLVARAVDATLAAGDLHRAVALAREQLDRLPDDASPGDRARLHVSLASAALLGDTGEEPLDHSTRALELAGEEPTVLRAQVMNVHAVALLDHRRHEEALRWAGEARVLGERLGVSGVVAEATTTIARVDEWSGDPAESRRTFERVAAQARSDGDAGAELRGLHHLGTLHYENGDLAAAKDVFDAAMVRARETGLTWAPYGFDVRMMAALTAYVRGDWEDALAIADVSEESPPPVPHALLSAVSMIVRTGQGERGVTREGPRVANDGLLEILDASWLLERRMLDDALMEHPWVVERVVDLWHNPYFMARIRLNALMLGKATHTAGGPAAGDAFIGGEAWVLWATRLRDEARAVLDHAAAQGRRVGPEGQAWAHRVEAEWLHTRWLADIDRPEPDELRRAWTRAIEAYESFGHVYETARSRVRLSTVHAGEGNHDAAAEELRLAEESAERLGATGLLREIEELWAPLRRRRAVEGLHAGIPGAWPSSGTLEEQLTPREHQVLQLVAEGMTNGEIARRLFISVKTVSVHVSRVLAKLRVSSRTEAAAVARRRGLLGD